MLGGNKIGAIHSEKRLALVHVKVGRIDKHFADVARKAHMYIRTQLFVDFDGTGGAHVIADLLMLDAAGGNADALHPLGRELNGNNRGLHLLFWHGGL